MNEELQEQLSQILQKSMEVAEQTGQWGLDKAPQLIEQYLMWEFWNATFFAIVGLLLITIPFIIRYSINDFNWNNVDHQMPVILSAIIGGTPGSALIICNVYDMLFITVAPEIYLIKTLL